jgi:hypothetical protein
MTLIEHKGLGVSTELKELTQRDLEQFYAKQREVELDAENISLPEYAGVVVRIASELDWFSERFENIDDWKPAKTLYLNTELLKALNESITIPPE